MLLSLVAFGIPGYVCNRLLMLFAAGVDRKTDISLLVTVDGLKIGITRDCILLCTLWKTITQATLNRRHPGNDVA